MSEGAGEVSKALRQQKRFEFILQHSHIILSVCQIYFQTVSLLRNSLTSFRDRDNELTTNLEMDLTISGALPLLLDGCVRLADKKELHTSLQFPNC